jgi:hypothetical protein
VTRSGYSEIPYNTAGTRHAYPCVRIRGTSMTRGALESGCRTSYRAVSSGIERYRADEPRLGTVKRYIPAQRGAASSAF